MILTIDFESARNSNIVKLAYWQREMQEGMLTLATVIAAASDVIDAQTVVDTIAAASEALTHQYHAALRKRDTLRGETIR